MSTAQSDLKLEILKTSVVIFGSPDSFTQNLQQTLQAKNCQVSFVSSIPSEEPDYALFIPSANFSLSLITDFHHHFPQTKIFLLLFPLFYSLQPPSLPSLTTIYLGETYSCHSLTPYQAPYLFHLLQSYHQGKIVVPNDGLTNIYPLIQTDLIQTLVEIIFNPYLHQPTLLLQSTQEHSLLSLAHQLQSLASTPVSLTFQSMSPFYPSPPDKATPLHQLTSFKETTDLVTKLPCLLKLKLPPKPLSSTPPSSSPKPSFSPSSTKKSSSRPRLKPLFPSRSTPQDPLTQAKRMVEFVQLPPKKSSSTSFFKKTSRLFLFCFVGLFIYLASLFLALNLTLVSLKKLQASFTNFTPPSQSTFYLLTPSLKFIDLNLNLLRRLPLVFSPLSFSSLYSLSHLSLNSGLPLIHKLSQSLTLSQQLADHFLGRQELDRPDKLIHQLQLNVDSIYQDLSLLSLKLPSQLPSYLPSSVRQSYAQVRSRLDDFRQQAFLAKTILPTLPSILGVGETKRYLLLFQNNMELRPTGGFIGSFATLEFTNAQLFNFQVFDVYQADGQLKGHVKPPEEIKQYLGEANWYLRDSNWDPNFPTTAKRVEWFIRKTLKQNFDGVFALNLNFVQQLLRSLGPLKLPDYQETITADNLFERAEYHSEINFFPGSTQKKDFLSALANQLYARLRNQTSPQDFYLSLHALLTNLNSHDVLLYFNDPDLNRLFDLINWNGRLQTPTCPLPNNSSSCFQDYLFIVDANLGINKANYFVRRSLQLKVDISKTGTLDHQLDITYTNTATSDEWPAGPYKNYQRLYLPYDTELVKVQIGTKILKSDQIKVERVGGKTVVGYLVQVPINQTVKVQVNYRATKPLTLNSANPIYSFYWQRQPGTSSDPLNLSLHFPLFLHPRVVSPPADLTSQRLNFNLVSSQDRQVLVQFSQ